MTREEAIETLKENSCAMCAYGSQSMMSCDIRGCDNRDAIKALEQEPKTGQWIDTDNYYQRWKCSECGCHTRDAAPHFCPNCGAKMAESEDKE
jgi:membrane protease subunit (stomatin/prohibitin family)